MNTTTKTNNSSLQQQTTNRAPEKIGSLTLFKLIGTYPSPSSNPDELKNRIRAALATAGYSIRPSTVRGRVLPLYIAKAGGVHRA